MKQLSWNDVLEIARQVTENLGALPIAEQKRVACAKAQQLISFLDLGQARDFFFEEILNEIDKILLDMEDMRREAALQEVIDEGLVCLPETILFKNR